MSSIPFWDATKLTALRRKIKAYFSVVFSPSTAILMIPASYAGIHYNTTMGFPDFELLF